MDIGRNDAAGGGEEFFGRKFQTSENLLGSFGGIAALLVGDAVVICRYQDGYGAGKLHYGKQSESYHDASDYRGMLTARIYFQAFDPGLKGDGLHYAYGYLGHIYYPTALIGLACNGVVAAEGLDIALASVKDNSLVPHCAALKGDRLIGAGLLVGVHYDAESIGDIHGIISVFKGNAVNGYAHVGDLHAAGLYHGHAVVKAAARIEHHAQVGNAVTLGAGVEYPLSFYADRFLEAVGAFIIIIHKITSHIKIIYNIIFPQGQNGDYFFDFSMRGKFFVAFVL